MEPGPEHLPYAAQAGLYSLTQRTYSLIPFLDRGSSTPQRELNLVRVAAYYPG